MSFVKRGLRVTAFASTEDVLGRDQRIFEQNEGLTDEVIEGLLVRATERVLSKIETSDWYRKRFQGQPPRADANRVKARQNDFTDLTIYVALGEYILPLVADFDAEDESERSKMAYYTVKANKMFEELIQAGDWYDFSGSGSIDLEDIRKGKINLRRVR